MRTPALLAVLLLAPALACHAEPSEQLSCRVTSVADGDTLTCELGSSASERIRLAEIDAPELHQAYGPEAKAALEALVAGKTVRLDVETRDRYGRVVATLHDGGTDVNAAMLEGGHAWVYTRYQRRAHLTAIEHGARRAKRGLWASQPTPTAPWDWRAGKRGPTLESPTGSGEVRGNRNSMIFHTPACPDYDKISPRNRVPFPTTQAAEDAGYRKAGNCP